jgi:cyclic pyranopterin phosphate synthase
MMTKLTHIDERGQARMVDVGDKPLTNREALAVGQITMQPATLALIQNNQIKKGDVLATARIAGIMAAKNTSALIPLCHPLQLNSIQINFEWLQKDSLAGIKIEARVKNTGQTGVEMEALTAVSIAALTIYDMAKAVDRSMKIGEITLLEKRGGQSGEFIAEGR